jgi:hypothetical protein
MADDECGDVKLRMELGGGYMAFMDSSSSRSLCENKLESDM